MEIKHRICISPKSDSKAWNKFQKLGIKMEEGGDGKIVRLNYFDINESDLLWPKVAKIITSTGILPTTETVFSKEEIKSSEWVVIRPEFIYGYPMPDLDFGYKNISFDPKKECSVCGVGMEQMAPIHLKEEPRLGKNDFMGINWTFNTFARLEIIKTMSNEGISGFEVISAIHHDTMEQLNTIKQLKFTQELPGRVVDDNLTKELPKCGHIKYLGLSRGMYKFPRDSFDGVPDFVKTFEWFGSGHLALRLILASSAFVNLYIKNKWKGLRLEPVELL